MHETGTAKQRTRSTRLHTTVETSLDIAYMDNTETSFKADIQPPWADVPQLALGCISDILSPEDTWGYGYDPSNLMLCDAGGQSIGSAKNHQRDKGILKTHNTAQYTVT